MKDHRSPSANKLLLLRDLIFWLASSLLAIVALESNALLGLAVAAVGGIILGILLVRGDMP